MRIGLDYVIKQDLQRLADRAIFSLTSLLAGLGNEGSHTHYNLKEFISEKTCFSALFEIICAQNSLSPQLLDVILVKQIVGEKTTLHRKVKEVIDVKSRVSLRLPTVEQEYRIDLVELLLQDLSDLIKLTAIRLLYLAKEEVLLETLL